MLVLATKWLEDGTVTVRKRGQGDIGVMSTEDFLVLALKENAEKVIF
jgi:threonyl-tRNA synthetase